MRAFEAPDPFFVHDGAALLPLEETRYLGAESAANVRDRDWMQYGTSSLFPVPGRKMRAFLEHHGEAAVAFTVHDLENDGIHVGNAYLMNLDWVHRTAETSTLVFREYRGRRLDVRMALLLLKYGFLRLGLRRIYAGTTNPGALATAYGMGMVLEARLRRASLVGAGVRDSVQFGILREEFLRKYGRMCEARDG